MHFKEYRVYRAISKHKAMYHFMKKSLGKSMAILATCRLCGGLGLTACNNILFSTKVRSKTKYYDTLITS